jgi:uncharacterized membrane protein
MNQKMSELALKILGKSLERVTEIERRVLHAVAARLHIARPVHHEMEEGLTFGERLADRVAALGGSWSFFGIFFVFLFGWILLNSWVLIRRPFDPYPYILLNLLLSCLAAIQAPVILMSQNRQAAKDRLHAMHDYEINLKAEIEILQLHEKIDRLQAILEDLDADRRRRSHP